jgi:hypothetical protein
MDARKQKLRMTRWMGSATRAHLDIAWVANTKANQMTSAHQCIRDKAAQQQKGARYGADAD